MARKLKGIRRRRQAWEVYVNVNRHRYTTTFPLSTPVQEMKDWRAEQIKNFGGEEARDVGRTTKPARVWWVYFVQGDTHVKIGRSTNVQARISALQTVSPLPLTLLAIARESGINEAAIHRRFAHLRAAGEWFHLTPDLQAFIHTLRSEESSCPAS